MKLIRAVLLVILVPACAVGQSTFEVASIKQSSSGSPIAISPLSNGVFHATNVNLRLIIRAAYHIQDFQLLSAPSWFDNERYDLDARSQLPANSDETRLMVQALLADRFQLKVRKESREVPAFAIVLGTQGKRAGLMAADGSACLAEPGPNNPCGRLAGSPGKGVIGQRLTMGQFAEALGSMFQRPVVDRTGLAGVYDLKFTLDGTGYTRTTGPPGAVADDELEGMSALIVALEAQLGLKLERTKSLTQVVVIEHAERPSAN